MSEEQTYLTQEKLNDLKQELENLKNVKRREVAERIRDAKELGDLSENAEYTEAKDDQAWMEGRILEIGDIIQKAVLIEEHKSNNSTVTIGCKIRVKNGSKEQDFEIVGSQEAEPLIGKISNESPLGKAFLGRKVGDEVEVEIPKGMVKYKILEVS